MVFIKHSLGKTLVAKGSTKPFVLLYACCFSDPAIHLHWRATNQSSHRNGLHCMANTERGGKNVGIEWGKFREFREAQRWFQEEIALLPLALLLGCVFECWVFERHFCSQKKCPCSTRKCGSKWMYWKKCIWYRCNRKLIHSNWKYICKSVYTYILVFLYERILFENEIIKMNYETS